MTPALATALAAAAVRIHAALRDLGDRPSAFQRSARAAHIDAVVRVRQELHAVPGLASSAEDAGPDAPTADLHTRYATGSGALTEACLVITQPRTAAPGFSISIPIAADVDGVDILSAWNAAIHAAWADEVVAHRARLAALTAILVVPADPVTPTEPA